MKINTPEINIPGTGKEQIQILPRRKLTDRLPTNMNSLTHTYTHAHTHREREISHYVWNSAKMGKSTRPTKALEIKLIDK